MHGYSKDRHRSIALYQINHAKQVLNTSSPLDDYYQLVYYRSSSSSHAVDDR